MDFEFEFNFVHVIILIVLIVVLCIVAFVLNTLSLTAMYWLGHDVFLPMFPGHGG